MMLSKEELNVKSEEEIVELFRKEMYTIGYEKFFLEISLLYDVIEDNSEEDKKLYRCLDRM